MKKVEEPRKLNEITTKYHDITQIKIVMITWESL